MLAALQQPAPRNNAARCSVPVKGSIARAKPSTSSTVGINDVEKERGRYLAPAKQRPLDSETN